MWLGIRHLAMRGIRIQARVTSLGGPTLRHMTSTIVVFPFRYRDARTGRWVKARYMATADEIAVRYAEWGIIGPGEKRRLIGGYSNSGRREK
jgi:hypothetical protein